MSDRPSIFTCEECGQPMYEVCGQCDGEGECEYSHGGCSTTETQMSSVGTCDSCWGSGWVDRECACYAVTPKPYVHRSVEEIMAKYRAHKESA